MTAIDRLIANSNSIISTLKAFSDSKSQDVTFTWINDDDSTTDVTYDNIVQYQSKLQDDLDNYKTTISNKLEKSNYARRMEMSITMSSTITFDSDKNLTWDNRLMSMGVGSDSSIYTTNGYLNFRVPAKDTVIPALGNADDITVKDEGIPISQWGSLYYKLADNYDDKDTDDDSWVFVGYDDDTGVIEDNWILVASYNYDTDTVKIAGQVIKPGVTIKPENVSDPIGAVNLQNIDNVIKDKDDNVVFGKSIPIKRLGDVLVDGYENDWSEYDDHWTCNISKDANGMVSMTGLITGGDKNTVIGKLPDEYLPLFDRVLSIQLAASAKFERVEVHRVDGDQDRAIYCDNGGTRGDDTSWVSINLSWQARVES